MGFNIKKVKHDYKKQEHKKQHKYYKEVETRGFHLLITPSEANIMRVKERLASQQKGKKAKAKANAKGKAKASGGSQSR